MEDSIISWTPENWLTVGLMGAIFFLVIGLVAQLIRKYSPGGGGNVVAGGNVVMFPQGGQGGSSGPYYGNSNGVI